MSPAKDFKSKLRLMTILIFIAFQIPGQYFSFIFNKYKNLPEITTRIGWLIALSTISYLLLEILEYLRWNYRYSDRKVPFILFLTRGAFLLAIIQTGRLPILHPGLSIYLVLLVFYSFEALSFPMSLTFCAISSLGHLLPDIINLNTDRMQYPLIFSTYKSLLMILFYLLAYFWKKDREYSDQNRILLQNLNASEKQLREYARMIGESVALEERTRLARDIHDSVGHALTAIQIQLSKAEAFYNLDHDESQKAVKEARKAAQEAMADIRGSLNMLNDKDKHFSPIDDIAPFIRNLENAGSKVIWTLEGDESAYNYAVLMTLFRLIQEGITNILKHAGPCSVRLGVAFGEEELTFFLQDDGRGFDPQNTTSEGHFGLEGLQNRVELVRGSLEILSTPGKGCTLKAKLPKDPVNLIGGMIKRETHRDGPLFDHYWRDS